MVGRRYNVSAIFMKYTKWMNFRSSFFPHSISLHKQWVNFVSYKYKMKYRVVVSLRRKPYYAASCKSVKRSKLEYFNEKFANVPYYKNNCMTRTIMSFPK